MGDKKGKNSKILKPNPLETLKDVSKGVAEDMRNEAKQLPKDFMEQLLGIQKSEKKTSGSIEPGSAIEMGEILAQKKEASKDKKYAFMDRRIAEMERSQMTEKSNELKIQLNVMQREMVSLAENTEELAEEVKIASMQAPVEPGVYHVFFFEKLLEFIRSFKKKINEASTWLHATNARAAKKNSWGANYKKHGAKYLLSGEHYVARAAG